MPCLLADSIDRITVDRVHDWFLSEYRSRPSPQRWPLLLDMVRETKVVNFGDLDKQR